ncbi:MAG: nickel-dependent hydrogenase large subunit [Bacteroidota bacterium]
MKTVIPFGPQHPVLPEPFHVKLHLEGETIEGMDLQIGYCHRGLEKLFQTDYKKVTFLIERICGICSFLHTLGYVRAVEEIMELQIPRRAQIIRTIMAELERVHSHLLIIGLYGDALGYENYFMQSWRDRELVMELLEYLSGNRVNYAMNQVGGVRRDFDEDRIKAIKKNMGELERRTDDIAKILLNDVSIKLRTQGACVLKQEDAIHLGAVGPVARASGVAYDVRETGYLLYNELGFKPVVETAGDNYARMAVRIQELFESYRMIKEAVRMLEETPGEVSLIIKPNQRPNGQAAVRTEAPRGEAFHYVKANGGPDLERVRVRTPTYANIYTLTKMLAGEDLANLPVAAVTIDPCLSCTDR